MTQTSLAGTQNPPPVKAAASKHGTLTVAQGTALNVGAVLGTGVLVLPGYAVREAGPASLLAWVGLVLLSIPLAATFAALGSRYPDAGGVSTYVRAAFGPRPAAVVGWWFYVGAPVGVPALALFGGSYLARVFHGGQAATAEYAALLLALGLLSNAFGVRISGRVQLFLSATLALILIIAFTVSLPHARTANLHPFAPHGWSGISSAAALLVWSFTGWETMTHLAGEFAQPKRDIKRATACALFVVSALYLGLAFVTVLTLGAGAGRSATPLASLLDYGFGDLGPVLATAVALAVTLGTINAYVASTAKLGAALARDGALPRYFAAGAETGGVPRRSLFVVAAMSSMTLILVTLTGFDVQKLVLSCVACLISVYVLGAASGIRLMHRSSRAGTAAAAAALALLTILLALTGWYLLWSALLAGSAYTFTTLKTRGVQAVRS